MAMWQHTFDVYVWRSLWRCKLDCQFILILRYNYCKLQHVERYKL